MAYNYEYPYTDPNKYNDDWLLKTVLEIQAQWEQYFPEWQSNIEQQNQLIAQIQEDLSKIVNLSPGFMEKLISNAIKNVWFGLTQSGYFVAYIPQSWSAIQFNTTGYDINLEIEPEYGHLVLSAK